MAKGDNRAVVGSSGKPLPGMVLESGASTVARVLGNTSAPSGSKRLHGGMRINTPDMPDHSKVK